MKYLKYIFLVIYIFITLFIFIKSFENSEQSSNTSDQVTDIIVGTIDGITPGDESITDKFDINDIKIFVRKAIGHFGIFLLLGIFSCLTYYYFINKKLISMIIIIVIGFITSLISEGIQTIPEGRGPSISDVFLNYAGYAISIVIVGLILYLPYYIKNKKVVS